MGRLDLERPPAFFICGRDLVRAHLVHRGRYEYSVNTDAPASAEEGRDETALAWHCDTSF